MTNSKTDYRRLIALDFDGVLHSYKSPWTDAATISDPPTPGAMEFLRCLVEDDRFDVVIVSSRCKELDGILAIRDWLALQLSAHFRMSGAPVVGAVGYTTNRPGGLVIFGRSIEISATRPPAFLTIDDRAWTFEGQWPDLDAVAAFKPWNKQPAPVKPLTFAEAVDAERLDEIENDRIETDIREALGSLGCVTPLRSLETDEIVGWTVFDGAVTIERDDLPVCAGETEGEMTRDHRRSLLTTIRQAYTAGLAVALGSGGNVEAAVDACVEVMDAGWHTADDVVTATLAAYREPTSGRS